MNKQNFNRGVYIPKNREKYIGKRSCCIFRSNWEYDFMKFLDNNENIKAWCSECVSIPYYFNKGIHKYFPDFFIINSKDEKKIIEIKPSRETKVPKKSQNKKRSTLLYEQYTYLKNQEKWKAANNFCEKRNWKFLVLTEKAIYPEI